ncbi:MAG: hypothetical protein ACI9G1_000911 [Pirellulaceae bacterium]
MISGLVLYLNRDAGLWDETLDELGGHDQIELGERVQARLPVVIDSSDGSGARDLTQWILDLPGVDHIDVTYVDLEEASSSDNGDR